MKNIYINGRYLTQQITGVQRFAVEVVRALDEQISSDMSRKSGLVFLVVPPGEFPIPSLVNIKIIQKGRLRGHLWEQLELPRIANKGLLFNPCGPAPLFHPLQVTSLHDASIHVAPAGYSWQFRSWHKLLMWRSGKNAQLILTVSKFSKQQLIEICGIPEHKIRVLYQSGNHILRTPSDLSILNKYGLTAKAPYVLCVGSQQANKNFAAIATAAAHLDDINIRFVVVGSTNINVFRSPTLSSKKMIFMGYVTDGELRALYENAMCFVFPSLYEGFGIPPLEAMACGCPVIASNTSSIPEACGTSALYFDPNRPEVLSELIVEIFKDAGLRDQLRERGLEQTKVRNWHETSGELARQLWMVASSTDADTLLRNSMFSL